MNGRRLLIFGLIAVAAFLAWRMFEGYRASAGSSDSNAPESLGTNLNSTAPELVGGSQGPEAGPAVQMPLTINLTTTDTAPPPDGSGPPQHGGGKSPNPVHRQRHHAAVNPGGPDVKPGAGVKTPDTGGVISN